MSNSKLTKEDKKALLMKAFATEEGTRLAYRVAKLPEPSQIALTIPERIADFQRLMLEKHSVT